MPKSCRLHITLIIATLQKTFIAVSDGVGGWSSSGHDPSLFSQSLMFYSNEAIKSNPSIDVSKALQKGYDNTMLEKGVPCGKFTWFRETQDVIDFRNAGSATACIISLDSSTGKLSAAKYLSLALANGVKRNADFVCLLQSR